MGKTIHVWTLSQNPTAPYANKKLTAAHTIAAALQVAVPGDVVQIWGDNVPGATSSCLCGERRPSMRRSSGPWRKLADRRRSEDRTNDHGLSRAAEANNDHGPRDYWRPDRQSGGGIYSENSAVQVVWNCIHDNESEKGSGGGIAIVFTAEANYAQCTVVSNDIHDNHSVNGGGVALIGVTMPFAGNISNSVARVEGNIIHDNEARGAGSATGPSQTEYLHGGGISVFRLSASILSNEIANNRAHRTTKDGDASGGGVCVYNIDGNDRTSKTLEGIPILYKDWIDFVPQVTLDYNHIHDNRSSYKGGGVSGIWGAWLSYQGKLIADNVAEANGGIYGTTRCIS